MGCLSSDSNAAILEAIYENGNDEHKNYLGSLKTYCKDKNLNLRYKFKASDSPGFNLTLYYNGQTHILEEKFDGTEAAVMYNGNMIESILTKN